MLALYSDSCVLEGRGSVELGNANAPLGWFDPVNEPLLSATSVARPTHRALRAGGADMTTGQELDKVNGIGRNELCPWVFRSWLMLSLGAALAALRMLGYLSVFADIGILVTTLGKLVGQLAVFALVIGCFGFGFFVFSLGQLEISEENPTSETWLPFRLTFWTVVGGATLMLARRMDPTDELAGSFLSASPGLPATQPSRLPHCLNASVT